jgi:hypothetical protein
MLASGIGEAVEARYRAADAVKSVCQENADRLRPARHQRSEGQLLEAVNVQGLLP